MLTRPGPEVMRPEAGQVEAEITGSSRECGDPHRLLSFWKRQPRNQRNEQQHCLIAAGSVTAVIGLAHQVDEQEVDELPDNPKQQILQAHLSRSRFKEAQRDASAYPRRSITPHEFQRPRDSSLGRAGAGEAAKTEDALGRWTNPNLERGAHGVVQSVSRVIAYLHSLLSVVRARANDERT